MTQPPASVTAVARVAPCVEPAAVWALPPGQDRLRTCGEADILALTRLCGLPSITGGIICGGSLAQRAAKGPRPEAPNRSCSTGCSESRRALPFSERHH